MGTKLGVCASKNNKALYKRHHDGEQSPNSPPQTFEELHDYRARLIQAYVFQIQITLYTEYVDTNFESFSIIPYRMHDIIGKYYPLLQIYGIGRGIINDEPALTEFEKLTEFESLLCNKYHLYKSKNKYFIKNCLNELFVIGNYETEDKFIKHFNEAHYDNNDGITFLNHFKQISAFKGLYLYTN